MEYLYSQTGKSLSPVLQNPEEEDRLVEAINDEDIEDEGFAEEIAEDITVPLLHEDDPSRDLEDRPSLMSPQAQVSPPQAQVSPPQAQVSPPQAPASPAELPSTSSEGWQHPATAAAASELPSTSQSDVAQVRHLNGYFTPHFNVTLFHIYYYCIINNIINIF